MGLINGFNATEFFLFHQQFQEAELLLVCVVCVLENAFQSDDRAVVRWSDPPQLHGPSSYHLA